MRKLFLLFWALLATTCLWAHDFEVNGIYYNYLNDNNVAVTYKGSSSYEYSNEYSGEVTIPETVAYNGTTYRVTSIVNEAFYGCSLSLISITIPNSVTSIGNGAFQYCSSLTSITIPNSVTSIGDRAFYGTGIYENESNWENDVLYIDNCLINAKTSISGAYTIKENTRLIADYAFEYCSSLTSITIPNSVTSIGSSAFSSCTSLTSITIPSSVTSIGDRAFYSCSSLTSIIIPNSVTSIGNGAFRYCSSLTSITIPNSVTSIGDRAFYDCSALTSIIIPNSVTSIGRFAFFGCTSLTSIIIPNSVTSIGNGAFRYCSSLTSITIPNSVTSIGDRAFYDCSALTSIIIPNSVTSIGRFAFFGCTSLTSIIIPNSVTTIGEGAFYDCSSLTSITIPNSVTTIGGGAFYDCSSLDTIICLSMTPPILGEDVFYRYENPTLFVPCEALEAYQAHEQWGQFINIQCIASEEVETDDVIITPSTTSVTITWPTAENAYHYVIEIKKDGVVFCTLTFNADGQLLNIAFAPSRDGNNRPAQYAEQVANGGLRFTVTGLEEATHYTYNIDVRDIANKTINSHSGEFTTQSITAVDNIQSPITTCQKVIRNGQLIILRDGKTYTTMGAEIQ